MNSKSIFNFNLSIKDTFKRFSFVFIFIFFAVLLSLFEIWELKVFDEEINLKLLSISLLSIIALSLVKLFVESLKKSLFMNLLLCLIILCLITYAVWNFNTSKIFLILAIIFSFTFAPLLFKKTSKKEFLVFNFETLYALVFSFFSSSVLFIGLSIIYASIGYLFEVSIPLEIYLSTCSIVYIAVFSILSLSKLSKDLDFRNEDKSFNKLIAFLLNYILVPLLYVYLSILYAYFIKIVFEQELPKGNLSWMILSFATTGLLTYMISFKEGLFLNKAVEIFRKYFYYTLILPLAFLYLAIFVRISTYGVTEARYAVLLLALFFTLISIISIVKKDFNFKFIPMILAFLFLFASLSPFNASKISANSQFNRFIKILKDNELLFERKISMKNEPSKVLEKELSSLVNYLVNNELALEKLYSYFENLNIDKNQETYQIRDQILKQLNMRYFYSHPLKNSSFEVENLDNVFVKSNDSTFIIFIDLGSKDKQTLFFEGDEKRNSLIVEFKDSKLNLAFKEEQISLDIKEHLEKLLKKGIKELSFKTKKEFEIKENLKKAKISVTLKLTDIKAFSKDKLSIDFIRAYLILKQK